jgi:hypothetical protein
MPSSSSSSSSSATAAAAAAAAAVVGERADDGIVPGDGGSGSVDSSPEGGSAVSGAAAAADADVDVDDGWGSIVVPAGGAGGGRRAVTLAEALRIGEETRVVMPIDPSEEERRRRGMLGESISIETPSAPAEEVAEEDEAEKAGEEVAKKEEEEVEEEEDEDEDEKTFSIESDVAVSATHEEEKEEEEEEEVVKTTSTIESDVAGSATEPLGTTMKVVEEEEEKTTSTIESDVAGSATHESPEAGEEGWTTIPSQESEASLTRRLSSDGKEIFEPSRSSSTEVNQENVDVGLFVLTQSLFALKSILNKD